MTPPKSEGKPLAETQGNPTNEDEEYDSEEDSDFDIDAAPAEGAAEEVSSDSELDYEAGEGGESIDVEAKERAKKRRRISTKDATDKGGGEEAIGELDSGDEATIRRGKEKKKGKDKQRKGKNSEKGSKNRGPDGDDEDDEADDDFDDEDGDGGGEGGFVRTRRMRMKMQEERKPLANVDQSSVDVDALWARINAPTSSTGTSAEGNSTDQPTRKDSNRDNDNDVVMADGNESKAKQNQTRPGEETITIKRKYKFAGDIITEEKVVAKDSAEAKLYLSLNKSSTAERSETEPSNEQGEEQKPTLNLRRPLRRISRFDPNPPGAIKRNWEKQDATTTAPSDSGQGPPAEPKGPKLNTVEKSKLDWAAYVDRAGIKDDLDVHSRAKEGYLGRMEFLNRLEDKREEERRNARLKNMG